MLSSTTKTIKHILAIILALVISLTVFTGLSSDTQNALSTSADEISEAKEKADYYSDKQSAIDEKIAAADENIKTEEQKQASIQKKIDLVQEKISVIEEHVNSIQKEINTLNKKIIETQNKVDTKKKEIDIGIENFGKRLRAMYIAGDESYLSMILGSTDFYDILMKVELVKRIAEHDDKMIDSLVAAKEEYESAKVLLEKDKKSLVSRKKDYDTQKAKMVSQRKSLSELYQQSEAAKQQIEKDKAIFTKKKSQLQAQEEKANALWQKLVAEAEARRQAELAAQQAAQQQQNEAASGNTDRTDGGSSETTGNFIWPVPGFYNITYGVGWRWGAYHAGIDIASSGIRGAQIVASDAGTVVVAENNCSHDYGKNGSCGCGGGYGRYAVVDHGNGYMTLYGHMENCIVSVGDKVNQGQTLGYIGSTGFSTGPHLHFEVRKDGVAQNPDNYV